MAKGGGEASPESNAVTPAQEPAAPAAPVLTPGDRQLGVSWTAPGSNGAPITGYDVRYRAATGGVWTPHPHAGTSTGATVTGLTNDVSYEVQVRAANRLGTGEWSPSATGTPSVAAAWRARLERVNAALAPEAARAMASSAALAVSERIRRLASGGTAPPPSARSLTDLLERHGGALEEGTVPPRRMLAGTAFALPAAADGGGGPATGFWASGDWRSLSGGGSALGWEGDMAALHLGADMRLRRGLLAGLAVSVSEAAFDWEDRAGGGPGEGEYKVWMTGVHPYAARSWADGSHLWAKGGYSTGEVEIDDREAGRQTSDGEMASLAAGGSLRLVQSSPGAPSLDLKGEALAARIEVEGNGGLMKGVDADIHRLRLAVAGEAAMAAGRDAMLTPSAEIGLRRDGGDGETGLGVELGGGVSLALRGLTVDAGARTLLAHEGEREEWGAGGGLRLDPDADGRGASFGLRLATGPSESGAERLWEDGAAAPGGEAAARPRARMEAEGGYGIPLSGATLTPHAGLGLENGGSRRYSVGLRLESGGDASLGLKGSRTETPGGRPGHDAMLRAEMRW